MTKKPLPEDRKEECQKLKAIFNAKKRELGLTQEKLADALCMNQSSVSHYLNGINPLNTSVAAAFAKILGVPVSEFSTRLALEIEKISEAGQALHRSMQVSNAIGERLLGTPPIEHYVLIPQFEAKKRYVKGLNDDHVGLTEGLVFRRGWIRQMNIGVSGLFIIYADDDAMSPYICPRDVVLFDSNQKEPRDKQVYLFRRRDGGISIKRMIQQLAGSWVIRSDNSDKSLHPDEIVSDSSLADLPIIGKVIWRGGDVG
jgi:phage repressor protein C with HTH and peptisase S24 domain